MPFKDKDKIPVKYRTDGRVFNVWHLQSVMKVKETLIRDLLFADNCALNANTGWKMRNEVNCSSQSCDNFSLTISTKKTEVMYLPAPGKPYREPHITVNGQNLPAVDNFTYIGRHSRAVNIDTEVNNRIAKARATFGKL